MYAHCVTTTPTIRDAREQAGLTQTELARRTGLSQPNISAYESGRRVPSEATLAKILRATGPRPSDVLAVHRAAVLEIAREHHAWQVRVFGSSARGEDQPGSDLDLLVDFDDSASLFDLVGLADVLEERLGIAVDVVSAGGLGGPMGERILATAVPL